MILWTLERKQALFETPKNAACILNEFAKFLPQSKQGKGCNFNYLFPSKIQYICYYSNDVSFIRIFKYYQIDTAEHTVFVFFK